jgi:hypothetical protein
MGRPSKLTDETQARICKALAVGATYALAAQYGGIGERTFYEWMEKGESAKTGRYAQFRQAIKRAEAEAAYGWLDVIEQAKTETWQAAAWKLERRYPESYGRQLTDNRNTHDVTLTVRYGDDNATDD